MPPLEISKDPTTKHFIEKLAWNWPCKQFFSKEEEAESCEWEKEEEDEKKKEGEQIEKEEEDEPARKPRKEQIEHCEVHSENMVSQKQRYITLYTHKLKHQTSSASGGKMHGVKTVPENFLGLIVITNWGKP